MDTILVVALSVLSTLFVLLIIGITVGLRKVLKKSKEHEKQIKFINNDISQVNNSLYDEIRKVSEGIYENIEELRKENYFAHDELCKRMDEQNDVLHKIIGDKDRDLDRRFETLYQKLYEHFPQLRKNKEE